MNTAQGSFMDGGRLRTVTSNTVTVPVSVAPNPPPSSPLPLPDMQGIDGKTYTMTEEISFTYPVSGATFEWAFAPTLVTPAKAGAQSMNWVPASAGMTSKAATTSAPRFTAESLGLLPGTYVMTVTIMQGSQSISASAQVTFVSANLSSVKVYPNPWRSDKHAAHPTVTFAGLTVGTTIKIFTVSGHEVKEITTDGPTIAWDLTNDSGDKVASGIYVYLITDSQGDKVRGKVALIK